MTDAPVPPPLSRPLSVADLPRERASPVSLAPDPGEAAALARLLEVEAIEGLAFEGSVAPWGAKGWEVAGRLRARITQACVVTLEPVVSDLDFAVSRRFLPDADPVDPEAEEDAPEPLGERIDLGAVVTEALALAIEPYPRAEGAALGERLAAPPGAAPLTDEAMRPFAGLAALKRKLEGGER